MDVLSPLDSDKVMQELFHQAPIKANDDHLVEFSEALRSKLMLRQTFCSSLFMFFFSILHLSLRLYVIVNGLDVVFYSLGFLPAMCR